MADASRIGSGIANPDLDQYDMSNASIEPTPSGGAIVNLDGPPKPPAADIPFDGNLCDLLTTPDLGRLGGDDGGNPHGEARALADLARDGDAAAHHPAQALAEREPQAGAAVDA